MRIWRDKNGNLCIGGYQPEEDRLDDTNPPRGGSGVPVKGAVTVQKPPTHKAVKSPFADHIPGLSEEP